MADQQHDLQAAMAALEARRPLLGDAVVDASLDALRHRLATRDVAPAQAGQTLRQASILFLDLVGSTSLSQHLDPEAIQAVMDGALERCSQVVAAHQGRVLQYAGDSLLGVFGADVAREDDAERAVRCGLALLDLGRALHDEVLHAQRHAGFGVRVGVHTGEVLLGGGVDADASIRGIAVNIAARMEQTAPAGALRISQATYGLVRGRFEVEAQPPMAVKGLEQPQATYLVRREHPRTWQLPQRGIEGLTTRMIGRDAELAILQQAFQALPREGRLFAITVVGDAGIGKSRLLHEFAQWARRQRTPFELLRARADPQTQGQPFALLRDMLFRGFRIPDDAPEAAARAEFERRVMPVFAADDGDELAEAKVQLVGHLIGLDYGASRHIRGIREDPRQLRSQAFHAAAQLLQSGGARTGTPVVLQLDDLHWADEASLEFFAYLAEVAHRHPLLMLGAARPELFERGACWPGSPAAHRRIELHRLSPTLSHRLAAELLQRLPSVPEALRRLVTGGAEGNPFYMEELVKMLVEQGAIATGDAQWTVDVDRLGGFRLPTTLVGVLQARLDELPAGHKRALQCASVIGQLFWASALAALDPQAAEQLPSLVRRGLVSPAAAEGPPGLQAYRFGHQILHQVTYDTLLKRERRTLHRRTAQWLAARSERRAGALLGRTAWHFEMGGDDARATVFHTLAAEHAKERFAHRAVLDHVQRALALLDRRAPASARARRVAQRRRWRLYDARERTLDLLGERDGQGADIGELERLAEAIGDDRLRAEAAFRRSDIAFRTADYATQASAARRTIDLATRAGDAALRLRGGLRLAFVLAQAGDVDEADALARQGVAEARARGWPRLEAMYLGTLSAIAGWRGDLVGGLELDRQCLAIHELVGNRRGAAIAHGNLGSGWLHLGDLERAKAHLDAALRMARENGDRQGECAPLCDLACLALWQREAGLSRSLARAALELARAVQARDWVPNALYRLGDADLALGDAAAARQAFEECRHLAQQIDSPWQHDAVAGLARVALAQGREDEAMRHVETLLPRRAPGGALHGADTPLVDLSCHRVLAQRGDPRAAEVLRRAHAGLQARRAVLPDAALRQGYLQRIPAHREILAAFEHAGMAGAAGAAAD